MIEKLIFAAALLLSGCIGVTVERRPAYSNDIVVERDGDNIHYERR